MLIVADAATCAEFVSVLAKTHVRVAFSRLLQAYLDGLHVLAFPPALCAAIEADSNFSVDDRAAAKKVRQKYAEHGGLSRQLTVFGRLVDRPDASQPVLAGQTWQIPLRWLAERQLLETQLVAEDLNDVTVVTAAAEDCLNLRRLFAFRVRVCPVPGGGTNTSRSFEQKAVTEQRITICFADSDKESPAGPIGQTAAKCQAVAGAGLYDLRLTSGRSLENALPWQLLDLLRADRNPKPSVTLASVEAATPGAARFANLKRGMFSHDICRLGTSACAVFWAEARISLGCPSTPACCPTGCEAAKASECREKFIEGLDSSTLADAVAWFSAHSGSTARQAVYMSSADAAEWKNLGNWAAEYGLGMKQRRL